MTKSKATTSGKVRSFSEQVDEYIAAAPEFAHPILERVREAFHQGCPQVEERIKWGCPHFEHHGFLGGMAAFKRHVGFGFWKARLMSDPHGLFDPARPSSMCTAKIGDLGQLPPLSALVRYVKEAARLNEQGTKDPAKRAGRPMPDVPADFRAAMAGNRNARKTFAALSASHRREYLEWILEAKQAATRERRILKALEKLEAGESRNAG